MKRVVVTLFTFVNPPIDWVPMDIILRNSRWGSVDKLLKLVRCQRVLFVSCFRPIDGIPESELLLGSGTLGLARGRYSVLYVSQQVASMTGMKSSISPVQLSVKIRSVCCPPSGRVAELGTGTSTLESSSEEDMIALRKRD